MSERALGVVEEPSPSESDAAHVALIALMEDLASRMSVCWSSHFVNFLPVLSDASFASLGKDSRSLCPERIW